MAPASLPLLGPWAVPDDHLLSSSCYACREFLELPVLQEYCTLPGLPYVLEAIVGRLVHCLCNACTADRPRS